MKLQPFFCFYGGKWRMAARYPAPRYGKIIEPFCGAAGYATRYHTADVRLSDADPVIAGVWLYLIRTSAAEIRRLPLLEGYEEVTSFPLLPEEAKNLIGFWLNKGASSPGKRPSAWMRSNLRPKSYWGEVIRERIAQQVDCIRHWRVQRGSYNEIPNPTATWFIDPPYAEAGRHYVYSASGIDYSHLAEWCTSRSGQVIVCENEGATWLPFVPVADVKGTPGVRRSGRSVEVAYLRDDGAA